MPDELAAESCHEQMRTVSLSFSSETKAETFKEGKYLNNAHVCKVLNSTRKVIAIYMELLQKRYT